MKKTKLLKTILIPTLGISTMGIITTVATSCNNSKPSTYSVTDGSLTLSGKYGTAGSDKNEWKLTKWGQEVTEDITWSIVEPVSGVSIKNGKVSWTNAISSGTYKFKVAANYNNQTYTSADITLTIATKYEVTGGSLSLSGKQGTAGSDEKTWVLKKDGEPLTEGVTWSIVEPVSGVSITDGKVSWTNAISSGTHKFKAVADYEGKKCESNEITLTITEAKYELSGGSLSLSGKQGTAGSDEKTWVLKKDGEPLTEGVTWSIVEPVSGVSITDGKVSWTNAISSGTYKFEVVATYKDLKFASSTITLTIDVVYQLVGESKKIGFIATNTGRDEGNEWHLMKDGKIVSEGVIWSLVATEGSSVPNWIKLNENNEISWTNAVDGTYSFNIQAVYDKKTFISSSPFVLNVGLKVYECVEVLANRNSTFGLINNNGNSPNLSYSFNGFGWYPYISPISIPKDQTLYLKGWNPEYWSQNDTKFSRLDFDGDVSISGNVMALLDNGMRVVRDIPYNNCFYRLFSGDTGITSVSDNFLPAINLRHGCYWGMFENCASLTKVPELPATTLADDCYVDMFKNCTSLTKAPELPAFDLGMECYWSMFENCTSLTEVPPVLPATILKRNCYHNMFAGCSSLTEAPALPALVLLEEYCCSGMFNGCTSLTKAPDLPAPALKSYCYYQMFKGCISLNSIKIGYTATPGDAPYRAFGDWVTGVADKGTFYYNGPDYVHPILFYFPALWVMKHY